MTSGHILWPFVPIFELVKGLSPLLDGCFVKEPVLVDLYSCSTAWAEERHIGTDWFRLSMAALAFSRSTNDH